MGSRGSIRSAGTRAGLASMTGETEMADALVMNTTAVSKSSSSQ
jgi:hypothetical protein